MRVENKIITSIDQVVDATALGYSVSINNAAYPFSLLKNTSQHIDYTQFAEEVEQWNRSRLTNLVVTLNQALAGIPISKVSILVVGSDARREKGPSSPFEFCILSQDEKMAKYVHSVLSKKIKDTNLRMIGIPNVKFDQEVEIKLLCKSDPDYMVSGFHGNKYHIWADRVLSGQIVFGSFELVDLAKKIVLNEYYSETKVRTIVKKQLNLFLSLAKTGKSKRSHQELTHFDKEAGLLYFNPESYIMGLKYAILRTIQQYLTRLELKSYITDIDPSTKEKISAYFSDKDEVNKLQNAYSYALWTYHLQQYLFNQNNEDFLRVETDTLILHLSNMLLTLT